jgi:NAD(P)-dependent dehydrogenase (short-subunit alcohol dehydrogenase family)
MNDLTGLTTLVIGASRGLGWGVASALAESRSSVVAVARSAEGLATLVTDELASTGARIRTEVADATDAAVAGRFLDRYDPNAVVLVAGAPPLSLPLQEHTWETFSVNWNTDVRMTFNWLHAILARRMPPESRVIVFSSGAALAGSPLSGGYAGAKATQRFMAAYAQDEANRAGLGLTFTALLPKLTRHTDLGRSAVQAYAARLGVAEDDYVKQFGEPVTPRVAGDAVVELLTMKSSDVAPSYVLTGDGLQKLS